MACPRDGNARSVDRFDLSSTQVHLQGDDMHSVHAYAVRARKRFQFCHTADRQERPITARMSRGPSVALQSFNFADAPSTTKLGATTKNRPVKKKFKAAAEENPDVEKKTNVHV